MVCTPNKTGQIFEWSFKQIQFNILISKREEVGTPDLESSLPPPRGMPTLEPVNSGFDFQDLLQNVLTKHSCSLVCTWTVESSEREIID